MIAVSHAEASAPPPKEQANPALRTNEETRPHLDEAIALIRFGCRCKLEEMQSLADVGYEFAEMDASVLYPTLDEAAFRRARQAVLSESLFPEVVHVPGLLSGTNGCQVELSLRDVFRRAALVGARTLLVQAPATAVAARGSAEAWRETTEALGLLGEHAARSGVAVAVAPGGPGALVEGLEEAWVLTEEVGHRAVGVAADLGTLSETTDAAAAGPALKHVWLPLPRRYGGAVETLACLESLGDLAELGYEGRVSVAADWAAFADAAGELLEELKTYGRGA